MASAPRRRACYRRRMRRAFDLTAMMASLLGQVAQEAGMTAEAVRLNALSVAGLISAVLAGRASLKRR